MAKNVPRDAEKKGSWHLLGEIKIKIDNYHEQQLIGQISESLKELNIQPLQLERILDALMSVTQKVLLTRNDGKEISTINLRIWVENDCACGRGWGFFVVEQPLIPSEDMSGMAIYNVELFLYQD